MNLASAIGLSAVMNHGERDQALARDRPLTQSLAGGVEGRAEVPRESGPLVAVESVAQMGIADPEACLREALNPRMPVEVLYAAVARLGALEGPRESAEPAEQPL